MPEPWSEMDLICTNADINIALDPEREEEVWAAAAIRAFGRMRRFGLGIEALRVTNMGRPADPGREPVAATNAPPDPPQDAGKFKMPFGKYRGDSLEDILNNDPGYFEWMATKCSFDREDLAAAVETLWTNR